VEPLLLGFGLPATAQVGAERSEHHDRIRDAARNGHRADPQKRESRAMSPGFVLSFVVRGLTAWST
jgi:hypothetical protein